MKIYLDNAATTRPHEEVVSRMSDVMMNHYGNPSSPHSMGLETEKILKNSGEIIGKTMNVPRDNIVFTAGGTESDNMAIMQPFLGVNRMENRRIIISSVEHAAVYRPSEYLSSLGAELIRIPVDEYGVIDLDGLRKAIDGNTAIISIMYVNNEVGTIQPVDDICSIKKESETRIGRSPFLHVDGVQAYGKTNIDLNSKSLAPIDFFTVSAHKIHGPKGTGALYVKDINKAKPLIKGGGQQGGHRSGTEDVSGIAGFCRAAEIQHTNRRADMKKMAGLRKILLDGLLDGISDIRINSPRDVSLTGEAGRCIPNILSVSFLGTKGEVILHSLEQRGIYISTESACSSKKRSLSPVLKAMGKDQEEIEGTIRFSLSGLNTEDEIYYTVEEVRKAVEKFRKLTGYIKK